MTWTMGLLIYFGIGCTLFGLFWWLFKVEWRAENYQMKLFMIATPVAWPLVILFILFGLAFVLVFE